MRPFHKLFLLLAIVAFFATSALSMPEFAVRYNQSCQLCHVNPTGGGMRAMYGAQFFSYMDLPMKELADFGKLDSINPTIGRHFQIGIDFRSLYFSSGDTLTGNSFVTMEGTLYTTIAPTDKTLVYLSKSIHGSFEAFALIQGFPLSAVFKAGRFIPAYGWKFVDHNSYVRSRLGYGQGQGAENGVEYGFYPLDWESSIALTNGSPGIIDGNRGKALTARALKRLVLGDLNMTGGMSWRYAEVELGKGQAIRGLRRNGGAFWGINWGAFTYLGEIDRIVTEKHELVLTHSLGYMIKRGVILSTQYDFHDPDLDIKNGYAWRSRIGANIYPTGYLELLPGFVWEHGPTGEFGTGELQLHVWF